MSEHTIYAATTRQIAGLELERTAHLEQIAGLVAERDALRAELNAMTTRRNYWRKLYYGDGAHETATAPAYLHSPGYPADDSEDSAAGEITWYGAPPTATALADALADQVSYE